MSELSRPRVLVVDDEDAIRRMARLTLGRSFEVFEASNVAEALDVIAAHDIEVVVTDVMMPGTSGIEACPLFRAKSKRPLHILLLTALGDQEHRNQGLAAGADDYLAKPIDRRELTLRVQHFVRLGRQERVIREQLESLSQLQALKDDLTALLVHDLRNPLTAVASALQLLEPSVPAEEKELFLLGRNALNRVLEGVGDILKVRMLERGELPLERTRFDPAELVRGVAQTLKAAALDGKIEVTVTAPQGLVLHADAKLMKRALENLLINAFRHTRHQVDIEVREQGDALILAVHDRGPGVPDFLKTELFDMFGSVKLKHSGGRRGHGLGLYLVRLVAKAHGGDVIVADRDGGGASFIMSLPAARTSEQAA